jgi:hypothetical protein
VKISDDSSDTSTTLKENDMSKKAIELIEFPVIYRRALLSFTFHCLFVFCSSIIFFIPFMHIYPYIVLHNAPISDAIQVIFTLLGGSIVGKLLILFMVDFTKNSTCIIGYTIPILSAIQTIFFFAWVGTVNSYNVQLITTIGFFLGVSSTSMFTLSHIKSTMDFFPPNNIFTEPITNVFHMTFMVPGSVLLMIITRYYTNEGIVNYYALLTIASCVSAVATVCSFFALYFSPSNK